MNRSLQFFLTSMAPSKGVRLFGYIACLFFLTCIDAAQDVAAPNCDQEWFLSVNEDVVVSWTGVNRTAKVTADITTKETNGQACNSGTTLTVEFHVRSIKLDNPCSNALYFVTLKLSCGTYSKTQNMTVRTLPGAPTIELKDLTNASVVVTWFPPPGIIQLYRVVLKGGRKNIANQKEETTKETSWTFNGLYPYTSYSVEVSASNGENWGKSSEVVKFVTLEGVPFEPENLRATAVSTDEITLVWNEPEPKTGIILNYEIFWEEDGVAYHRGQNESKNTSYVVERLLSYTTYHLQVAAVNTIGRGPFTNVTEKTALGVPDPPVIALPVFTTNTSVLLKWDLPDRYRGPDPTYTLRWKADGTNAYVTANSTIPTRSGHFEVRGLKPFTKYHFQVRGQNPAGNGSWSQEERVKTLTGVPSAPKNLKVESQSATHFEVSWDLPSPANGLILQYKVAWKAKTRKTDYTNDTTYEATSLSPYTDYDFQVSAKTEAGWGDWSPVLRVKTNVSVPSAPQNLNETGKTNTSIQIEWFAPVRKNGPSVTYVVRWKKIDASFSEGDYYYDIDENVTASADSFDGSDEVNETAYNIKNLESYTTYSIQVCAKTSAGEGPYTDPLAAKTVAGIPGPPTAVKTTNVGSTDLKLLWQPPKSTNGPLKGYVIHWGIRGIGGSEVRTSLSRYEAAGLRPYTEYIFVVVAETEGGQGPNSSVRTTTAISTPSSPREVYLSEVTENSILVEWSIPEHPNAPLLEYTVHWREQSVESTNQIQETNATSYRIRELFPDANYSVRIRARTKAGDGPWSSILYVRTKEKDNSTAIIAGSVVGSFLVLLAIACVVVLYLARKNGGIKNIIRNKAIDKSSDTLQTTISVPLEVLNDSGKIRIENFDEQVLKLMCNGYYQLAQEYEKLGRESPAFPSEEAKKNDNLTKNRWVKILPFDYSRVKLRPVGDEVEPDFINASYVPGDSHLLEYIATQGPLPNTVNDFWRMVWQESVFLMVMLTQCVERAKRTCERYWPSAGTSTRFGDIEVHSVSESITPAYIQRLFLVAQGGKQRHIVHLHYMNWPVSGCPKSPDDFLTFVRTVRGQVSCGVTGPMLVHCSAGIGRTGTFIAVDRLYHQLNRQCTDVDVYGTVLEMRRYRANLVQTEDQYYFIYLCAQRIIHENRQEKENDYAGGIYSN